MARRRRRRHDDEMELNLIPMIDVMLILLIFFMVATTIKHGEKALPIELPKAEAAATQTPVENLLVIGVDQAGNKYVGGERVTTDALHERIRDAGQQSQEQPVRIDADRHTSYENIIEVVQLCQFEHLRNVSLHTQDPEAK